MVRWLSPGSDRLEDRRPASAQILTVVLVERKETKRQVTLDGGEAVVVRLQQCLSISVLDEIAQHPLHQNRSKPLAQVIRVRRDPVHDTGIRVFFRYVSAGCRRHSLALPEDGIDRADI